MQIRLTVVGPQGGGPEGETRACDVLVTAPDGTELAAVSGALAGAVGVRGGVRGGRAPTQVHLYAGARRLEEGALLGHPPLVEGAVLSVDGPGPESGPVAARFGGAGRPFDPEVRAALHVAGGPDAGGVHLLHAGRVLLGRAADADVPVDDPDVSRTHLVLEVDADGGCRIADAGSTNGTVLEGRPVGGEACELPAGALVHVGESTLRVRPLAGSPATAPAARPDGRGHFAVPPRAAHPADRGGRSPAPGTAATATGWGTGGPRAGGVRPGATSGGSPGGPPSGLSATVPAQGGPGARLRGARPVDRPALSARHQPPAGAGAAGAGATGGSPAYRADDLDRTDRQDAAPHTAQHTRTTPISGTPASLVPTGSGAGSGAPDADPASPADRRAGGRARRLLARGRDSLTGRVPFPLLRRDAAAPDRAAPGGDPVAGPEGATGAGPDDGASSLSDDLDRRRPDAAQVLLTALAAGPRLWERGPGHPDALALRLGSAAGVPVTADLRAAGSLGVAGPRPRLSGVARLLAAQLATWHAPSALELVLVAADAERPAEERLAEWSWLCWLPHLRPAREQPCRLLTAFDADQAVARLAELTARADGDRLGLADDPPCVLILDGDPGSAEAADAVARLLVAGPAAGVHVLALAEHPAALPPGLGALARITGEVDTLLALDAPADVLEPPLPPGDFALDAVSAEWAERVARALAPLREGAPGAGREGAGAGAVLRGPLPATARLLDLLDLELVTPAKVSARWAGLPPTAEAVTAVLGTARDGDCAIGLADPEVTPDCAGHVLIGGRPGAGRTELLRTLVASAAVAESPDRLEVFAVHGRSPSDPAEGLTQGLTPCTDLPHVTELIPADDPARSRQAADLILDELARRERMFEGRGFASWYAEHALAVLRGGGTGGAAGSGSGAPADAEAVARRPVSLPEPGGLLAVRTAPPPRLLVVVDDYDEVVAGGVRTAALAEALEEVALRGARIGVHLVAATSRPDLVAGTALDEAAQLRIALRTDDADASRLLIGVDDAAGLPADRPGRAFVRYPDGGVTAFQAARVSGRIPRTATLRPTVVALDWAEAGAPPTRRPVRELGNGPTDLALLGSALARAAERFAPTRVP